MMIHHHNAMIAVLRLLFSAACAHAATVTPAAAAAYYFSTPLRPAHLHGEVMGSPPAYYIPRSEDFDWLRETTMEREALSSRADGLYAYNFGTNVVLRPEFGKWALSEANRFYRWATAVDAAEGRPGHVPVPQAVRTPSARSVGVAAQPEPAWQVGWP